MWYLIICISVVFYVILDGFDLGVGCLHLFATEDRDRRIFLNAIGPVWDGNEVWIVIIFGGLLAGFPPVYATLCSSFYTLIMILIAGLMFRAASIEFRSKHSSKRWRRLWDALFSIASYVIAFCISLILGNLIEGIAIDQSGNFLGSFRDFFTPYTVLIGLTGVFLFMMHGTAYLLMKTEGELRNRIRKWLLPTLIVFLACYATVTALTLLYRPHMISLMRNMPVLFSIGILALVAIINIPYWVYRHCDGFAFIASCVSIALLFALFGLGTFPYMIRSTVDPARFSLTFFNAASSATTLRIILLIAAIGVPLVIAYGFWIYRIFSGKVRLDETSY